VCSHDEDEEGSAPGGAVGGQARAQLSDQGAGIIVSVIVVAGVVVIDVVTVPVLLAGDRDKVGRRVRGNQ
jgi:hypothetical protein